MKKEKDDKKEKEKEKDKREREKKEDKDEKEKREDRDRKEEEEDKDEKMEEDKQGEKKDKRSCEKEDGKDDKKEEEEEEEEMEEDEEEEADDEDSKDETPGMKVGETKEKDERRDSKDGKKKDDKKDRERREKKEKKKMVTVDPFLLLSFVYFDQTHTGYIIDRDLEDIINMLGLNLSRAQQKKLMSKVMSRDVLHYRKMTDVSLDEKDKPRDPPPNIDLEFLAKGNNTMMPVFVDALSTPMVGDKALRKGCKNKEDSFVSTTLNDSEMKDPSAVGCTVPVTQGVVKYGGSLVDIGKLIQQLEKSENARSSTEEKLKELQKELMFSKEESKKAYDKCSKLNKEIKSANSSLKTMEEELQKAIEDNNVYQKALNQIKCVIKPLVAGVDLDEEDVTMKDITRDELKLKQEPIENGTSVSEAPLPFVFVHSPCFSVPLIPLSYPLPSSPRTRSSHPTSVLCYSLSPPHSLHSCFSPSPPLFFLSTRRQISLSFPPLFLLSVYPSLPLFLFLPSSRTPTLPFFLYSPILPLPSLLSSRLPSTPSYLSPLSFLSFSSLPPQLPLRTPDLALPSSPSARPCLPGRRSLALVAAVISALSLTLSLQHLRPPSSAGCERRGFSPSRSRCRSLRSLSVVLRLLPSSHPRSPGLCSPVRTTLAPSPRFPLSCGRRGRPSFSLSFLALTCYLLCNCNPNSGFCNILLR
ncbi:putative cell division cycle and apoptosis regulator protein 1-like isoform X2 [Penaeus vannamei]|uniref:Putative cell division cycle and apoptosis regulator protein 1-like isoform X2 n=1 Tax=Penaeus vannamei TaxID=6689 RepID=A0A423TTF6_PENVA|nr:putative cell division cycle and apoptosis regulator protein 1-like isoform X2 [Penaeus vannamei]